jgi:hypothetical protein
MPVHDWSRVRAGKFHHFHNSWIYKLSDRLNGGILPPGYYAAGEQVAGDVEPDVLTLRHSEPPPATPAGWHFGGRAIALQEQPPQVSYTIQAEAESYRRKQDHLVIRSPDPDRIVALIEIVSRANKDSRRRMDQFLQKIAAAFDTGYHALVIDLHPPGTFDPHGIHGAIWDYLFGTCPPAAQGRPLTLASYCVEPPATAYVEPLAVGTRLPDMPLFLAAGWYVNVPLEETYSQTWEGFPAPWKEELTARN